MGPRDSPAAFAVAHAVGREIISGSIGGAELAAGQPSPEAGMRPRPWLLAPLLIGAAVISCDLPGAAPPTAFVFPTPNETLTAIFAPTATVGSSVSTATPPPATIPATVVTPLAAPATATISSLTTRPNGVVVQAERLEIAPGINGDLGEWTSFPYKADQIVYGASRWTGASDNSGDFAAAWDASYLYLAVRVTDDKYVQAATGDDIWMGDEVEVQLDADLPVDYYTASLSADDYQVGLSAGNFGSIAAQSYRWYPSSKQTALTTVTVAGKLTPTGYELEARIPWTTFSLTPAEGARYGFALSISDNDAAGTAAQQSMVSSVSTRKLTNPTTWGTLALGSVVPK
jgi:hypothetical protein